MSFLKGLGIGKGSKNNFIPFIKSNEFKIVLEYNKGNFNVVKRKKVKAKNKIEYITIVEELVSDMRSMDDLNENELMILKSLFDTGAKIAQYELEVSQADAYCSTRRAL
jgi:hypothetical protein